MNKILLSLLLCLSCYVNSYGQWTAQPQVTGNPYLYQIDFLSATNGIACGELNGIYNTSDGGVTWVQTLVGDLWLDIGTYLGIHFTSSSTGYIVGGNSVYGQAAILKTSDGGNSWTFQLHNNTNYLRGIHFPTASVGYTVGDNGIILKTTNAGLSWLPLSSGTTRDLESVFFTSPNEGYIVGDSIALKTINGGTSWSVLSVLNGVHYKVKFRDLNSGYIVDGGSILHTADAGVTWSSQYFDIPPAGLRNISIQGDTAYTIGYSQIYKTINNGGYWARQQLDTAYGGWLFGIDFVDANTGWVSGIFGTLIKTINSGGPALFPINDAGISTIGNISCSGNQNVQVTLKNYGIDTLNSAMINWKVDGNLQTPFTWSGTVLPNAVVPNLIIGNFNFPNGSHIIDAWTSIPNAQVDDRPNNDSSSTNISVSPCNPNDAGVFSLTSPAILISPGIFPVNTVIKNYGTQPLTSATIFWVVDGIPQTSYVWSGTLLPNASSGSITIGSYNFSSGSHSIKTWTDLPNNASDGNTLNDTILVNIFACNGPFNGTYTVGTVNSTFPSISDAVTALVSCGINGSVVLNIASGIYTEQVTIPSIAGSSFSNKIIFQSASGDSSAVVLTYAPTSSVTNYTLLLANSEFLEFNNISIESTGSTFSTVIQISGTAKNISFNNCQILGVFTNLVNEQRTLIDWDAGALNCDSLTVKNCYLLNNRIGLDIYSNGAAPKGIVVLGNIFTNQSMRTITLVNSESFKLSKNTISIGSTITQPLTVYGIYCQLFSGHCEISKNKISILNGGAREGIGLIGNNTSNDTTYVTNNFISLGTTTAEPSHGITDINVKNLRIYNNSVLISGLGVNSKCISTSGTSQTYDRTFIRNNIMCNMATGKAFASGGYFTSNNNDMYTNGTAIMSGYPTLAIWQSSSGQDLNSISVDPIFNSVSDLHLQYNTVNNLGTPLSQVIDDIDDEGRSPLTPDIGADEYTPSIFTTVQETVEEITLSVSPNPSHGIFKINSTLSNGSILILNALGERVYQSSLTGRETDVDLSSASKGVYFYLIMSNKCIISKGKVVLL